MSDEITSLKKKLVDSYIKGTRANRENWYLRQELKAVKAQLKEALNSRSSLVIENTVMKTEMHNIERRFAKYSNKLCDNCKKIKVDK